MAKFSDLTELSAHAAADILAVAQSGTSKRTTMQKIADWVIQSAASFLQSGSGATARTVQAKLRETVSVTDFGAVNAAGTDNATAFANAVAALPSAGGELFVPAGTYDLGSVVAFAAKKVRLVGEGLERSIIQLTGSAAAFSSVNAPYLEFQGLTIKRKTGNANTITNLLDLTGANQLRLIRCNIGGADTSEVKLADPYNVDVDNCLATAKTAGSGKFLEITGTAPTTIRTRGNEITSYSIGMDMGATFGSLSLGDIFVNCSTGRKFNGGNTHVSIGTWAENASAGGYVFEVAGTSSVNVVDIGTRISGANPPTLYNLTGGALRSQVMSLNGQSAAFLNYTHNIARCQVKNSATQAVAHNTNTILTFDTENFDTDAMHSTASNTGRITFNTPGTYRVSATVTLVTPGTGAGVYTSIFIRKNGATTLRGSTTPTVNAAVDTLVTVSTLVSAVAGDYVEAMVYQNTGVSVNAQLGEGTVLEAEWAGT